MESCSDDKVICSQSTSAMWELKDAIVLFLIDSPDSSLMSSVFRNKKGRHDSSVCSCM